MRIEFSKPAGSLESVTGAVGAKPTILLVEDDEDAQALVAAILRRHYEIALAKSAEEARTVLREADPPIVAVVMDIELEGGEDGLQLTRWIRTQEAWTSLPVIANTAHAFEGFRQEALEAGCDHFLAKPITRATLLALLDEVVTP